jgi:hypothetical protein
LGDGWTLGGAARYGIEDRTAKGRIEGRWQNAEGTAIRAYYANDFREIGDVAERSRLVNSIAAQELGSDYTSPYRTEHVGLGVSRVRGQATLSIDATRERHTALLAHATPARGTFEPLVTAAPIRAWRATARADHPTRLGWLGTEFRGGAELRLTWSDAASNACGLTNCVPARVVRGAFTFDVERPLAELRLVSRSLGAFASGSPAHLAQELIYLGGPVTAPGYRFHELVADRALSQSMAIHVPVPFPAIRLGRFGRSPARAVLAPHVTGVLLRAVPASMTVLTTTVPFSAPDPIRPRASGFYPSAGVTLITAFDLFTIDVSRGLRGGAWTFSFDVSRPFWGIL